MLYMFSCLQVSTRKLIVEVTREEGLSSQETSVSSHSGNLIPTTISPRIRNPFVLVLFSDATLVAGLCSRKVKGGLDPSYYDACTSGDVLTSHAIHISLFKWVFSHGWMSVSLYPMGLGNSNTDTDHSRHHASKKRRLRNVYMPPNAVNIVRDPLVELKGVIHGREVVFVSRWSC